MFPQREKIANLIFIMFYSCPEVAAQLVNEKWTSLLKLVQIGWPSGRKITALRLLSRLF
jgi:hypothetical protein